MKKIAHLQIRINEELKKEAEKIAKDKGITLSEMVRNLLLIEICKSEGV